MRVHRKLLSAPIATCAEPPQLSCDRPAAFGFPVPDFLDELLAREVAAFLATFGHLPLDNHLRRNAGMIGPRDPQRVLALQPRMADENVLQRHIKRMADME